jgi:hypothetical protein
MKKMILIWSLIGILWLGIATLIIYGIYTFFGGVVLSGFLIGMFIYYIYNLYKLW